MTPAGVGVLGTVAAVGISPPGDLSRDGAKLTPKFSFSARKE